MTSTKMSDTRLFVTKIPPQATESELTCYFGQFGELKDVHLPRVPGRGGHKGIAFVSYSDPECAQAVREMQGHVMHGQALIVDHATTRAPGAHRKYMPGGSNYSESAWNTHGTNSAVGGFHGSSVHGGRDDGGPRTTWHHPSHSHQSSFSHISGSHGNAHHYAPAQGGSSHAHPEAQPEAGSNSWWESVIEGAGCNNGSNSSDKWSSASTRAGNNSDAGSDNSRESHSNVSSHPNNGNNSGNGIINGVSRNDSGNGEDFWDTLYNSFWGENGKKNFFFGENGKGSPQQKGGVGANNPFEKEGLSGGCGIHPQKGGGSKKGSPNMLYNKGNSKGGNGAPMRGKGVVPGGSPPGQSTRFCDDKGSSNPAEFVTEADKIFVTKIASTITRENLVNYFTQFGELVDVYMPPNCDATSGLVHKGIAFVSFRDTKTAEHVLKRTQYEIKPGKFIVVDRAKTRRSANSIGGCGHPNNVGPAVNPNDVNHHRVAPY